MPQNFGFPEGHECAAAVSGLISSFSWSLICVFVVYFGSNVYCFFVYLIFTVIYDRLMLNTIASNDYELLVYFVLVEIIVSVA